jgi:hypothetical protein
VLVLLLVIDLMMRREDYEHEQEWSRGETAGVGVPHLIQPAGEISIFHTLIHGASCEMITDRERIQSI